MRIFLLVGLFGFFGIAQETFIPQQTKVSKIVEKLKDVGNDAR